MLRFRGVLIMLLLLEGGRRGGECWLGEVVIAVLVRGGGDGWVAVRVAFGFGWFCMSLHTPLVWSWEVGEGWDNGCCFVELS